MADIEMKRARLVAAGIIKESRPVVLCDPNDPRVVKAREVIERAIEREKLYEGRRHEAKLVFRRSLRSYANKIETN